MTRHPPRPPLSPATPPFRPHRGQQEPANNCATQRRVLLAAIAQSQRHGNHADDHCQRRHQNRPERSEEQTSELQSHLNLVCRLLVGKKKVVTLCAASSEREV